MPLRIRFDKVFDGTTSTTQATNFDGTAAPDVYAEEFLVGPAPSKKFRRLLVNGKRDDEFFDLDLNDLKAIDKGFDVVYGSEGVTVTQTDFDGLKNASLFKFSFDYNTEDAYLYNGIIDARTYRSINFPEDWLGYRFIDIFNDIFTDHNTRRSTGTGPVFPASDIEFDSTEFSQAIGASRAFAYAGPFSFRNTTLSQVIDQLIKREGNSFWWVEFNNASGKWRIRFQKRVDPNSPPSADPFFAKMAPNHTQPVGNRDLYNVVGPGDSRGLRDPRQRRRTDQCPGPRSERRRGVHRDSDQGTRIRANPAGGIDPVRHEIRGVGRLGTCEHL